MRTHIHVALAGRLIDHGYDVLRINLYDIFSDARKLIDCTLEIHADDINTVLDQNGPEYNHINLVGHSYGGPSIMFAQPDNVDTITLLDPTFHLPAVFEQAYFVEKSDHIVVKAGTYMLIGKQMKREAQRYAAQDCLKLSRDLCVPVQVLTAEFGYYPDEELSWHSAGPDGVARQRKYIKNAGHLFTEPTAIDQIIQHMLPWFQTTE
jgi:pimeloyl-ACP methyl ester carboxylesterase